MQIFFLIKFPFIYLFVLNLWIPILFNGLFSVTLIIYFVLQMSQVSSWEPHEAHIVAGK